ncbi:ABC transporter substrate-binding protein [Leifsonia naganoensis]|uniref:Peptide/nickel transport system substrate-binding protein n=1 Tax=Leifsonia naganoensis TaxID=150025 RepID=A0A853DW93_9MICO|nr:peptide/nickel transport system substrate-binding protein [Leifsonia naganoensis]
MSLDPAKNGNGGTLTMFEELAYQSLIERDVDGKYVPGLASSWGYVPGHEGTQFQLQLRTDAKFADGTSVTPDAVANSINYFVKTGTGPNAGSFAGISAAPSGDHSVLITCANPNPVLPELLTANNYGGDIISPAGLKSPNSMANATFGAGPYVYQASQSITGDHYTYTPNKYYYDQSRIHYKKIVIRVISNSDSALQALQSNQVAMMSGNSTQVAAAKRAGLTVSSKPSSWNGFFIFDTSGTLVPALGSTKVRQALNYAVDRDAIAKAVYGDAGSATDQPNTPGADGYSKALVDTYKYDPAKAKSLLAEAGYADGFSFSLVYPTYQPDLAKVMQAVAEQLSKVGVTVNLKGEPNLSAWATDVFSKQYPAGTLNWGYMTEFLLVNEVFGSNALLSIFKTQVPGLSEAFDAYTRSTDATREETAQAVQKVLVDQAASVPVVQFQAFWFSSSKLKGFALDSTGSPNNPADWTSSN